MDVNRYDYVVLTPLAWLPHLDPSDLPDRSLDVMSAVTPRHVPQIVTSDVPSTLTCCNMTHWYVQYDALICATRLNKMFDMTRQNTCPMTRSYVWYESIEGAQQTPPKYTHLYIYLYIYAYLYIHINIRIHTYTMCVCVCVCVCLRVCVFVSVSESFYVSVRASLTPRIVCFIVCVFVRVSESFYVSVCASLTLRIPLFNLTILVNTEQIFGL